MYINSPLDVGLPSPRIDPLTSMELTLNNDPVMTMAGNEAFSPLSHQNHSAVCSPGMPGACSMDMSDSVASPLTMASPHSLDGLDNLHAAVPDLGAMSPTGVSSPGNNQLGHAVSPYHFPVNVSSPATQDSQDGLLQMVSSPGSMLTVAGMPVTVVSRPLSQPNRSAGPVSPMMVPSPADQSSLTLLRSSGTPSGILLTSPAGQVSMTPTNQVVVSVSMVGGLAPRNQPNTVTVANVASPTITTNSKQPLGGLVSTAGGSIVFNDVTPMDTTELGKNAVRNSVHRMGGAIPKSPRKADMFASSSKQKGPSCKVCSDEASGFHYGVDSCEGCKVNI